MISNKFWCFITSAFLAISVSYADTGNLSTFPMDHYDQTISTWINASDPDYNKSLLSEEMQQKRLAIFYDHYFGSQSPWSSEYINQIFRQSSPNDFKSIEQNIIHDFDNEGKSDNQIGYGENFRPYTKEWIDSIADNINLSQFDGLFYQSNKRGIAVDNLHVRILPTDDAHFYHPKFAGQGYPFDNLQMSSLWAGTPVYIIGESRDHSWMLVVTPDFMGWVKSNGIAKVDEAFVVEWKRAAKNKLVAITQTKTSIVDNRGKFLLTSYVGSVFPGDADLDGIRIRVPVADANRNAVIKHVRLSFQQAAIMPVAATPHNFSIIMRTLAGRPYGWGGMYFYNDCSSELKSLFTPFGIWLPRHSSDQMTAGKMVDMSSASSEKRLSYLKENGHRFLTIVYIGGHVLLHIGNYSNTVMTYQNMWGLSPNPPNRRAVVGGSVFFPMLLQYPEDTELVSHAAKKTFQMAWLDEIPVSQSMIKEDVIDIRSLMFPEFLFN
jgi:cell wall-associated NlpC family hydrolase